MVTYGGRNRLEQEQKLNLFEYALLSGFEFGTMQTIYRSKKNLNPYKLKVNETTEFNCIQSVT